MGLGIVSLPKCLKRLVLITGRSEMTWDSRVRFDLVRVRIPVHNREAVDDSRLGRVALIRRPSNIF